MPSKGDEYQQKFSELNVSNQKNQNLFKSKIDDNKESTDEQLKKDLVS